ncbi:hypothetical protein G6F57_016305 [Rhizopus arrhizus]|nr:hypothetical protein G6F57_016305 [Rhizopus arrhizus]
MLHAHVEHRVVDLAELLGLHRSLHHGIDFSIARPDVLQAHFVAVGIHTQHVLLDIEADSAGDGVGDHQRRRSQEGLLGVRMDAAIEVAVARQHSRGVQVTVDDFLLDLRVQRATHAVAGGAGKRHDAEAQLFQVRQQAGLFQVQLHGLRARRQRRLHPRLALQATRIGIARQQCGGDHVARIGGIGAAGDGRDDHCTIGHQALRLLGLARFQLGFVGNAALGQRGGQHPPAALAVVGRAFGQHVVDLRAQRNGQRGRQRPRRGGPDRHGHFDVSRHAHAERLADGLRIARGVGHVDRRRFLFLVLDLGFGQRRTTVEAPVHRLGATHQVAVGHDLGQRTDLVGLEVEAQGC